MSDYPYENPETAPFAARRYNRESDGNILRAGNGGQRKEAAPMNQYQYPRTEREPFSNPLLDTISASEELLVSLDNAARRLERAIADDTITKAAAADARESLAQQEAEYVVELTVEAEAGQGPLAGIARTSKSWQYALDKALADVRRDGLRDYAATADKAAVNAMNTSIALQQAQAQFRACLAAAELRTAILNGHAKSSY